MRQIDLGEPEWTEDEDGIICFVSEDGKLKWKYEDTEVADWKEDPVAVATMVVLLGQRHPTQEVVILNNDSDTYIFASMGDAIVVDSDSK